MGIGSGRTHLDYKFLHLLRSSSALKSLHVGWNWELPALPGSSRSFDPVEASSSPDGLLPLLTTRSGGRDRDLMHTCPRKFIAKRISFFLSPRLQLGGWIDITMYDKPYVRLNFKQGRVCEGTSHTC